MAGEKAHLQAPAPSMQRDVLAILLAGVVFLLFAILGIQLTRQAGNIALFWPANAIAVALLIRHGHAALFGGCALVFTTNIAVNLYFFDSTFLAAGLSVANILEIAVCIFLLRKLDLNGLLNSDPNTLYWFVWYVAVASAAGAVIGGTLITVEFDQPLLRSLLTFWVVDFASAALVLCLLFSWPRNVSREKLCRNIAENGLARILEFAAAGALTLAALVILTFADVTVVTGFSPLMLWVALRYGVFITSMVVVLIGLGFVTLASGVLPVALFDQTITPLNVVGVQTALILISVPALFVSAVVRALDRSRAELEEKQDELVRSNKGLTEFTFFASHDLQEPLRKIASSADALREDYADKIDEDGRYFLKIMTDAATNMRSLIVDLLQYARFENAQITLADVDLGAVLTKAKNNLDVAWSAQGADLNVSPLPCVRADSRQVEQLFQNLLGNALKYRHPDRRLEISVAYTPAERNDPYATIVVSDNGIGFDEIYAETIFEPFKRLHSRSEIAGSGIGLAICSAVCGRHGWSISAFAIEGEGARFIVKVPRNSIVQP